MLMDPRVLSTDHVPQSEDLVVARNDELDALTAPVRDFLSGFPETHCILVGPTGVGKTLLSKFVCERVEQEEFAETIYIDCWHHHSTHALYRHLLRPLGEHVGLDERGVSKVQLRERFRERVADSDPCIVVLDELVQLDDFREFFTLYDCENVFVIGASNDYEDLLARMDASGRSRFRGGRVIELASYTERQLRTILDKRIQHGVDPAAVPEQYRDQIVAGADGDARVAIEALYQSIRDIRGTDQQLSSERVGGALSTAREEIRQRSLSKLKYKQRLLLEVLADLDGWVAMSDIEPAFAERHEAVTRETLRNHLRALIHYNHVESKGERRWTRYRLVTDIDAGDFG